MSYRAGLGFALTAVIMAAGCATPGESPLPDVSAAVTITNCGQELRFDQTPLRVVTLEQSATETLLALGLGDRMVGTAYLATKILPEYQVAYDKVPS